MIFSSRILVVTLPLLLVGCLGSSTTKMDDSSYLHNNQLQGARIPQPQNVYQPNAVPQPQIQGIASQARDRCQQDSAAEEARQSDAARPQAVVPIQEPALAISQANQAPDWQPLDGHLVQAGDFLMELKRSKGGQIPTHAEMNTYLQAKMGITSQQAGIILEELGV